MSQASEKNVCQLSYQKYTGNGWLCELVFWRKWIKKCRGSTLNVSPQKKCWRALSWTAKKTCRRGIHKIFLVGNCPLLRSRVVKRGVLLLFFVDYSVKFVSKQCSYQIHVSTFLRRHNGVLCIAPSVRFQFILEGWCSEPYAILWP